MKSKNWLIYSIHDRHLREMAQSYLRGRLIDIGCGGKPYRALLAPFVTEHVGLDYADSGHDLRNVDIVSSAYQIPTEDSCFDSALCTSVLEHLAEPEKALRECHRVLKPEGTAVFSAPFIWHLHEEPQDFYRFSKYGLQYLFEKTGFEILEIRALSGFWVTFGQLLVYNLHRLNRGVLKNLHIPEVLGTVLLTVSLQLDKMDRTEQWSWMHMAAVRKK